MKTFAGASAVLALCASLADAAVTVPIYKRDVPLPSPEQVGRRLAASANTGSVVSVPAQDWIEHTADLQWYTKMKVGTPPQEFNIILDTGSYDMFIASKDCESCGNAARFDPTKSTTFGAEPGIPQSFGYDTGVDTSSLLQKGAGVSGIIVNDTIGVANLSVPAQQFLLCDKYPDFMQDVPMDGVMGMGPMRVSGLPSQLSWFLQLYSYEQIKDPVVSFYYPPGRATGAEATFGGTNPARYTGKFTRVYTGGAGQWEVPLSGLSLNGKAFQIPAATTVLDTGTPFFTADANITKAIYASISSKIVPLDDGGSWGAPCDIIDSLAVDMTFKLGSGKYTFDATMPKEAFNLGPYEGQPGMCQAVFSSLSHGRNSEDVVFILGAPLLSRYYTTWDGLNNSIGFAKLVL